MQVRVGSHLDFAFCSQRYRTRHRVLPFMLAINSKDNLLA